MNKRNSISKSFLKSRLLLSLSLTKVLLVSEDSRKAITKVKTWQIHMEQLYSRQKCHRNLHLTSLKRKFPRHEWNLMIRSQIKSVSVQLNQLSHIWEKFQREWLCQRALSILTQATPQANRHAFLTMISKHHGKWVKDFPVKCIVLCQLLIWQI